MKVRAKAKVGLAVTSAHLIQKHTEDLEPSVETAFVVKEENAHVMALPLAQRQARLCYEQYCTTQSCRHNYGGPWLVGKTIVIKNGSKYIGFHVYHRSY